MIIGEVVTFDGRYGEYMGQFLGLLNYASVIYKGSEIEIDGLLSDNSEVRFNNSLSSNEYNKSLVSRYENAVNELEITLFETYSKSKKLTFIINIICEVDSLRSFLKKSEGVFTHKLFQYSNKSTEQKFKENIINESDFQEYYFWMNHYLKKISRFLKSIKKSIESTSQIDVPLPPSMIPDKNTSTKDNPLEYFEYLFARQGLFKLKQSFIPSEEDCLQNDAYYNPKTEIISYQYQDNETGEWEESTSSFKDFYYRRLYSEYQISQKNIDDHICELKDEVSITFFLKLTLSKLKFLLTSIDSYEDAKKYDDSKKPINGLMWFIHEKYAVFVPKDMIEDKAKVDAIENKNSENLQKALPSAQATEVIVPIDKTISEEIIIKTNDEKIIKKSNTKVAKITFGYKTSETKKLENVLKELTLKIDLLVDSKTNCTDLLNLLCSKNFINENYEIYIGCETTQFSYIIKKLAPYFKNLNPATIESSNYFYSKKGTLFKAQNLYSNTIDNPKEKETIDNIIKLLQ